MKPPVGPVIPDLGPRLPGPRAGRSGRTLVAAVVVVAAGFVAVAAPAGELTPEARRGKRIYMRGVGSSPREIVALVGDGEAEVPASVLTCVSCHGPDGVGRPEGGVTPSRITWEELTKPYGLTHDSGRRHPPYDGTTMARAIVEGVDPAGNPLLVVMPRYRMASSDMGDLVAFLKGLGDYTDPGLTATTIRLGTFVPTAGPGAEIGEAMRAMLAAQLDRVNREGGIHNRRLELRVLPYPATEDAADAARRLEQEDVFAVVGGLGARGEKGLTPLAESQEIPWIGPLTLDPEAGPVGGRFVFYLFAGVREQALALVTFAARELPPENRRAAVFHPGAARAVGEAVEQRCRTGWASVTRLEYLPERPEWARLVAEAKRQGAGALFFLGSGVELKPLLEQAERLDWAPSVFLPGPSAGREVLEMPAWLWSKTFLAFPAMPVSPTSAAGGEYFDLVARHELPARQRAVQLWAYAAGKVLVEGLRSAGRLLSREKLMTALEGLYEFETGVTARISYGPNRRIGAQEVYMVTLDRAAGDWVPVGERLRPE